MTEKNRKILSACIAISMLLHACFLAFLQNLTYPKTAHSHPSRSKIEVNFQFANEKIPLLETLASSQIQPTPQTPQIQISTPFLPIHTFEIKDLEETPFHLDSFLISKKIQKSNQPMPIFESIDLTDLTKNLITPPLEKSSTPLYFARTEILQISNFKPCEPPFLSLLEKSIEKTDCKLAPPEIISPTTSQQPVNPISLPNLPQIPSLSELETINVSEFFETDLQFIQNPDQSGYTFALTLIPRPDLKLPIINQKILFLIDRSNSIQNNRLLQTKSAIRKAIEELPLDTELNIIAFDTKISKLFPTYCRLNSNTISQVQTFLDKISLGNFFSPADLYKPLLLALPGDIRENELYSIILLTDSENLAKSGTKINLLKDWTAQNRGRVSLFSLGLETDHHKKTLEALCNLNQGDFVTSTTIKGIKRRLLKLTKSIQHPIAKSISSVVISSNNKEKIQLCNSNNASHLYLNQPYVILGSVKNLDDFILFVQGRSKDQWLNIKKHISFIDARKANASLFTDVALKKTYELYQQYCYDGNTQHLTQAKQIAKNNQFSLIFE